MKPLILLRTVLLACLAVSSASLAQQPAGSGPAANAEPTPEQKAAELKKVNEEIEKFGWTRQGVGKVGNIGQIAIPQGYRFTDGAGASKMLQFYGNPPNDGYLGMLATENFEEHSIIFEFDDVGYVKDDEKNDLKADELLESMKEAQEAGNARRKEMGLDELEITGWAVPPRFNDQTKNLEWALKLRSKSSGGITINHNTRILGRKGVMEVTLLCSPEELEPLLPSYQKILTGFSYVDGERYAEYRSGDKLAEYGLTALIAGGGAFALAKSGLLAKFFAVFAKLGKAAYALVIGVLIGIKKLFDKLVGNRNSQQQ
ncbi:MAG: DUF2167 domain-containing protein [Verrucomicrobiaceae bacterium]|nr:DUF2167 domain-containing protein [Verrucomicrobiaceae bacterium]